MATAIFTSDNAAPLKTEVISICLHENAKVTKMDAADAVIFAASKCVSFNIINEMRLEMCCCKFWQA